eukprot:12737596-Alexandrium_andersonii.AAC.1
MHERASAGDSTGKFGWSAWLTKQPWGRAENQHSAKACANLHSAATNSRGRCLWAMLSRSRAAQVALRCDGIKRSLCRLAARPATNA